MFVTADLLSLIVQGIGGAYTSFAAMNKKSPVNAGRIMMGGIIIQVLAITLFFAFGIEFLCRFKKDKPFNGRDVPTSSGPMDRRTKKILIGASFSAVLIYVRCV